MSGTSLRGLVTVAVAMLAFAAPAHAGLSVLDNGKIRLGVDLDQGGKITWLSQSQGEHADNLLFEAEQSYYGAGDWHAYQDPAAVVDHTNDGHTLYTRAFALSCECTMETWITLNGDAAIVRNRLTSFRSDTTRYPPGNAELPALYTANGLYRAVSYTGFAPYTRAPVTDLSTRAHGTFFTTLGGANVLATEHWAALVNDADFGIGLIEPGITDFKFISGNASGFPAGYVAGTRSELWDANVTYVYTYSLVVGGLADIRDYAYAHRPDPRPNYVFAHDRQHFIEYRTTDAGFPIHGALRIPFDQADPQLDGPHQLWPASRVPRIYIRGAWHSPLQSVADVWWYDAAGELLSQRPFNVIPDGAFRTYRVDIGRSFGYAGTIGGLRLDPALVAEPGAWADITCISWKPCPIDREAERALGTERIVPFLDSFDTMNAANWSVASNSAQVTPAVTGGALVVDVPADAQPLPGQQYISAGLLFGCRLGGDFDVQVDYRLSTWPDSNGVIVNLLAGHAAIARLNGDGGERTSAFLPPYPGVSVADDRLGGTLRFARKGVLLSALYRDATGAWVTLGDSVVDAGRLTIGLTVFTQREIANAADVTAVFDNFRVNAGEIDCG